MRRRLEDRLGGAALHDDAQIHDRDPVTHQADDPQVVRDEDIRQVELPLHLFEEAQDRRLHGDVQAGSGFIEDDEARVQHQGARQGRPPLLSAAELVRIALQVVRFQPDRRDDLFEALTGFRS